MSYSFSHRYTIPSFFYHSSIIIHIFFVKRALGFLVLALRWSRHWANIVIIIFTSLTAVVVDIPLYIYTTILIAPTCQPR